ncbi:MAG TPA: 30S ribosomal protein S5 [Candidatus Paceibacterota bacterium]|nr:30S ribosomal protein S5 [Candidatus Paceibacterota bacterium]
MTDTTLDTNTDAKAPEAEAPVVDAAAAPARDGGRGGFRSGGPGGRGRGPGGRDGGRGRGPRAPRERSEFEQATLEVRRVARVMAGGRRFSFSVTVVIGDKKGRVGVGLGKGADTALAIDKAVRDAKKHLVTVKRTPEGSIAHDVSVKYSSSIVTIIPSPGRGVVAGSAMRSVLEHAGVTNVIAKILTRTKNKLTIARATVAALASAGAR